ncbi:double-strand break repair helicase AddA [Sphingomonas sp. C3-2]|uniref:double-strand break repair helicase AddA n=1 Tax=Sphingomonas sp. C3-2 TaxID=3062169 RepID=UPI00294B4DF7|nr:double-strand break repair helicase AddA [Sphingomonas sp. C3-2]WOK37006.1 double-strand break repair helicase AddA [Sphingomonas sp. C3-2]
MAKVKPLLALRGNQKLASDPQAQVWLSASAGTGKTHVLTARVMRLLLSGADPSTILCLTFTKAGAAEMADRIHARLAHWVRLPDTELARDLMALGEDHGPESRAVARTLFARVLDASGSGLRIQTIHSFCQTLLAGFPVEAGLIPGFRPMEAREEKLLARTVLADMLVGAENSGDEALLQAVQALSRRLGEGGAEGFLMDCAAVPAAMANFGADIPADIRAALGVPEGDIEQAIIAACADDAFDMESVRRIGAANAEIAGVKGLAKADMIAKWRGASPELRAQMLADLLGVVRNKKGEPFALSAKMLGIEPGYEGYATRIADSVQDLLSLRSRAELAAILGAGLEAGRRFATLYAEAKRLQGSVDFNDLIRKAVELLGQSRMADWIRFKLDQATDHILVDEAQDTNAQQWAIVSALAGEFFSGDGSKADRIRTIFSVGDYKQAIFGFQGTDPINFQAAQIYFARQAESVGHDLLDLSLIESFRSTEPVLELVDALLDNLGHDALGLMSGTEPHKSAVSGPGIVTLWNPVSPDSLSGDDDEIEGDESWLSDSTRSFATRLARQIRHWLEEPLWLESKGRPLRPEDILILVRRRSELASLIVARLYAEGVPVAGIDRLRLNAPLVVRDLLSAIRFALQPEDDLNFAGLLVSPIIGWTQEQLMEQGLERPKGRSLYRHLRDTRALEGDAAEAIRQILGQADLTTPYRFLENLLSGPVDARRKLLARLGAEARDPIEELLNAALQFESDSAPSLQLFIDWFDRGDVEIVRDPSAPLDAVRVMTAHGAKGLQAPLVILADATVDPTRGPRSSVDWDIFENNEPVPVFRPRKGEAAGSLAEAVDLSTRRELQEHWRLLYVALTRAEERLIIGGALGPQAKGVPHAKSWHAAIGSAFEQLGVEAVDDGEWGGARHFLGHRPAEAPLRQPPAEKAVELPPSLPEWLHRAAPEESRPPRPLAPSSMGPDDVASPPPGPEMRRAAERGRLLHALFERLPDVARDAREGAALHWLEHSAGLSDPAERAAIAHDALAIVNDPVHADLFGADALAEAPIAAVVTGDVIAGTVDRLLVRDDIIRIVDFKTGRRVPAGVLKVPTHHLRQMSAYAEALRVIFPGRRIVAELLYTAGPALIELPEALLAAHKPGLAPTE